jgi:hypothetical protein
MLAIRRGPPFVLSLIGTLYMLDVMTKEPRLSACAPVSSAL